MVYTMAEGIMDRYPITLRDIFTLIAFLPDTLKPIVTRTGFTVCGLGRFYNFPEAE